MHDYIAITGSTANWLLSQAIRKTAITSALTEIASTKGLTSSVVAIGSLRIAACPKANIVALWNKDLLLNQGYESWGLCRLTGAEGLLNATDFLPEIFERFLSVTDLRLKGLKLDGSWVHRHTEDDFHTCIAGRGSDARRYSLGFSDRALDLPGGRVQAVLAIGPLSGIINAPPALLKQERRKLPSFILELTDMLANLHARPALENNILNNLRSEFQPITQALVDFSAGIPVIPALCETDGTYTTLTYDDWIKPDSPLSLEQRAILESDLILKTPVRIIGPAGSGKTLLMQLLAIRRMKDFKAKGEVCKIAYVVHNSAMMQSVRDRFSELNFDLSKNSDTPDQTLDVLTLTEYSIRALQDETVPVMDSDAYETKRFQKELVKEYLIKEIEKTPLTEEDEPLLHQILTNKDAIDIFSELLVNEFGVAIKAHDLSQNKQGYVLSEAPLSRLHSILNVTERSHIFDVFSSYQTYLSDDLGVLDADDLAITVLGKVSTPLWRLKRKNNGYDFIFVDEAQLFNENERRLFPLLTKGVRNYVPIVLGLDNAQTINANAGAGFGALGFGDLSNESLNNVFRSTPAILKLAFHTIQKTTDLFDSSFPDFTTSSNSIIKDDHHLAKPPVLLTGGLARAPGRFAIKIAQSLRASNLRQICIIVFGDRYWKDVIDALTEAGHPWKELIRRGDKIESRGPLLIATKPEFVGGQEFDAVICIGLEEGVVPPNVGSNHALAASFDQRALREMYVSFTRARYRLIIANSTSSNISPLLKDAKGICLFEEKASDWLKT